MIFNLLTDLTDPDNIPDGIGGLNYGPIYIFLIAGISIFVTICAAYLIYKLYKKAYPESKTTGILILIIAITITLIVLYIVLTYIGYKETA